MFSEHEVSWAKAEIHEKNLYNINIFKSLVKMESFSATLSPHYVKPRDAEPLELAALADEGQKESLNG